MRLPAGWLCVSARMGRKTAQPHVSAHRERCDFSIGYNLGGCEARKRAA